MAAAKKSAKKSSARRSKKSGASKKSASKRSSSAKTSSARTTKKAAGGAKKKAPAKKAASTGANASSGGTKKKSSRGRKSKSPFDSRFLEQMRKSLVAEREVYDRQATMLKAEADSLVADIEPGDVQFDEESGEGDTIAVERNRDLALSAQARDMIDEIDHALSKFDEGTYGLCEVSGEPIPKERLEAIPWARERVEYKVGGFGRR